jgi:hypothetical protein
VTIFEGGGDVTELPSEKAGEVGAGKEPELAGYEPPRVESTMTAEDVEHEALYAGSPSTI